MTDLAGTVVLLTGATGGIGRATASQLSAREAVVVAVGRDERTLLDVVRSTPGSCVPLDLTDPAAAAKAVEHALAVHGRLDAVVDCAGVGFAGPFEQMTPDDVATLVDVNVRAPMMLARAAVPVLRAQGAGALVFVTSIAGSLAVPGESVYSGTKAALEMFAEALREELHGTGVTVSTVVPGVVDTGFHKRRLVPYARRFPRPMPPARVARDIVTLLETGDRRRVVPRWLAVPVRISGAAPRLYRSLARRFS